MTSPAVTTAEAACTAYRTRTGYPEAHLAHLVVFATARPTVGTKVLRRWLRKLEWSEDGIDKLDGIGPIMVHA